MALTEKVRVFKKVNNKGLKTIAAFVKKQIDKVKKQMTKLRENLKTTIHQDTTVALKLHSDHLVVKAPAATKTKLQPLLSLVSRWLGTAPRFASIFIPTSTTMPPPTTTAPIPPPKTTTQMPPPKTTWGNHNRGRIDSKHDLGPIENTWNAKAIKSIGFSYLELFQQTPFKNFAIANTNDF
ncbi:hypothetical protein L2E82_22330 [Cichorium intybus]|uniref:Uncharacterized protein n=1 Tax=Cichorium intybus TaxID=13427 RepID=A0ACB9DXI1_CICIN|nr:hypothetical protein L2E82_22330 [Cichorium intybus]